MREPDGQQYVPVMGETIDHGRRHLIVGEDRFPLRKLEIRRQYQAPPFIAVKITDRVKTDIASVAWILMGLAYDSIK